METQSNILIIVILLQPELENDIFTPALAGQKPPELRLVFGLRCTQLNRTLQSGLLAFQLLGLFAMLGSVSSLTFNDNKVQLRHTYQYTVLHLECSD